jgi:tetratricopeptide (TPR) repeat protein
MLDIYDSLRKALAHFQAGRVQEAEDLYRAVLAAEAEQPQALNLYGVLCTAAGRHHEAIALLTRAVAADPEDTSTLFNLGNAYYRQGDTAAALRCYRDVAERRPGYAEVFVNMGQAYQDGGQIEQAIAACRQAIKLRPALLPAYMNLGRALLAAGQTDEAIAAFDAVIARKPDAAEARANLAMALHRGQRHGEAIDAAQQAIGLDPNLGAAHLTLGSLQRELGRIDEAIESFKRAIALSPDDARAQVNLGNALLDQDRLDEAEVAIRKAVELDAKLPEAQASLGYLLTSLRQFDQAIAACDRAIALRPDFAEPHWNQGFAYLLAGDFARGWEKYEWRKRHPRYAAAYPSFPQRSWEGEDIAGRTLLIHAEQGLGDSIQLIRYAAPLAASGIRIVVACDRALIPIFSRVAGVAAAVDKNAALPAFDLWIDQMSLPRILKTRVDNIPAAEGYLSADPARVTAWQRELATGSGGPKVGLVWAGNPTHSNDHRRSLQADQVRPWLANGGLNFFSLQVGTKSRDVECLAPLPIRDLSPRLTDFMETAAAVSNLDLVIAVDTAVAHLAGALGKPVWTLLPYDPDWRWVISHPDDSPWYTSMRLFRQDRPRDWNSVVTRVGEELKKLATGDKSVLRPARP